MGHLPYLFVLAIHPAFQHLFYTYLAYHFGFFLYFLAYLSMIEPTIEDGHFVWLFCHFEHRLLAELVHHHLQTPQDSVSHTRKY